MSDLARHGLDPDTDTEVFVAALCLRCPKPVGGDLYLTHGIVLYAVFHLFSPPKDQRSILAMTSFSVSAL